MKTRLLLLLTALLLPTLASTAQAEEPDARTLIESAMEVYSWFTIAPLDVNCDLVSPDGTMYRVLDDNLCQPEIMERYLDYYFAYDIVLALWDWQTYQNVDGVLYSWYPGESPLERPIDQDISEVTYALAGETDTVRTFEATVYYLSSEQPVVYEFIQQNLGGQWVFTEFPFFW